MRVVAALSVIAKATSPSAPRTTLPVSTSPPRRMTRPAGAVWAVASDGEKKKVTLSRMA